jgi:tetratricopeptide (TPR) repeat protein
MADWGSMGNEQAIAAARETASRALDIDPTSSEALAVLGRAASLDENRELAGDLLAKSIEVGPNDAVALDFYARHLRTIDRPRDAEDTYRTMLRLDPLSEDANSGLAATLASLSEYEEALDSERASGLISVIERAQGKFAKAIAGQIHDVSLRPDDPDPEVLYDIGLTYLAIDMPGEASLWFDRAIERNPQHAVSRAAPLTLDYYNNQIDEDSFRLARELLTDRIDNRYASRFIALLVLTEYGAKTNRHEIVLDTLDNLNPHLFDDPPRDLDKGDSFFVGEALLKSGDTDRGLFLLNAVLELENPGRLAYGTDMGDVVFAAALGDKVTAMARLAEFEERSRYTNFDKMLFERASQFDLLRDEPAFIAMLEKYDRHAADQRQLLHTMKVNSAEQ